ncbi:MAG: hypothetical protein PHD82_07255 [Candidatus Riflebacteria bacterium]|nr:hypothetical protein [Candidatus Riflebacteria bacterium]
MSETKFKKIALAVKLILSAAIALLTGLPNFSPARSVPGGECYETCSKLTSRIGNYNAQISPADQKNAPMHVFTETPENIAFLKNEPSIDISLQHGPDCVYGTIGDLAEDGFVVCRYHGTYNDSPELKNREATFFLPDKGIVKVKGLPSKSEFAKSFRNELRFYAIVIVIFVFIVVFILFSVLLKFFFPKYS